MAVNNINSLSNNDLFFSIFHNQNLSNITNPNSNYQAADFYEVNLSHSNLAGSNFSGSAIHCVDFTGANLQGCDFSYATMYRPNFCGADLRGVNFCNARISFSDFKQARLGGAIFNGILLNDTNRKLPLLRLYGHPLDIVLVDGCVSLGDFCFELDVLQNMSVEEFGQYYPENIVKWWQLAKKEVLACAAVCVPTPIVYL